MSEEIVVELPIRARIKLYENPQYGFPFPSDKFVELMRYVLEFSLSEYDWISDNIVEDISPFFMNVKFELGE